MWAHYEERKRKTFPISVWHPHTLTHKTREMILPLKNIFLLRLRARKIKRSSNGILYVPEHTLMYHRMRSHPRGCESIPLPDRERETHLGHNRHAIYADIAFFRVMDGYIYGDAVKWTVISHPHKDKTNILWIYVTSMIWEQGWKWNEKFPPTPNQINKISMEAIENKIIKPICMISISSLNHKILEYSPQIEKSTINELPNVCIHFLLIALEVIGGGDCCAYDFTPHSVRYAN